MLWLTSIFVMLASAAMTSRISTILPYRCLASISVTLMSAARSYLKSKIACCHNYHNSPRVYRAKADPNLLWTTCYTDPSLAEEPFPDCRQGTLGLRTNVANNHNNDQILEATDS